VVLFTTEQSGMALAYQSCMAEQVQETVVTPVKKSSPLIYVLIGIVVLAGVGVGAFLRLRKHHSAPPVEVHAVTSVLHLETFVVNLADEDQHTFLRIGVDLGVASGEKKKMEGEGEPVTAPIRDVILGELMATRSTDLATLDGKQKLKDQILRKLNERLPQLHVQEIYFTEYLLQQ
jgi:flagellar FliL protein